jgi:flotillin
MNTGIIIAIAVCAAVFVALLIWILSLRTVVPTNMVHVLQKGRRTISCGVGCKKNVYYKWPEWLPILGIKVRALPVSNFDLSFNNYEAYDENRLPFMCDIQCYFRISDTNAAAQKIESINELNQHLQGIVKGAVRSLLAKSNLEEIMSERSKYGAQFTDSIKEEVAQWGVECVKNIELMDIKDSQNNNVIVNIMAKKKSEIEKESRTVVARNNQEAEQAEIRATQEVKLRQAEADLKIGEARAETDKQVGIAQQQTQQSLQEQMKVTKEREMKVLEVDTTRRAEITKQQMEVQAQAAKQKTIIDANAEKERLQVIAEGNLIKSTKDAEATLIKATKDAEGIKVSRQAEANGIEAVGKATAEALKQKELASVTAQTTLAKEIGNNVGYQKYLITIRQVEAHESIGVEQARNLRGSEIKIIANAGDVTQGVNKVMDLFSPKGGTALGGMLEGIAQSELGKKVIEKIAAPKKKEEKTTQ